MRFELVKDINLGDVFCKGVYEGEISYFSGKFGVCLFSERERPTLYVGLGDRKELTLEKIREAASKALKELRKLEVKSVLFDILGWEVFGTLALEALVEGILVGGYSFSRYKKDKEHLEEIYVYSPQELTFYFERAKIISEAKNLVRDIVNEPANIINPESFVIFIKDFSQDRGLLCDVFDVKRLKEMKMVGIVAVGSGSANPPYFVHLKYLPENPRYRVVLVGKGVTFDSGGLSLKSHEFMKTMKMDKAGAATVLGVMDALVKIRAPVEVHGLIPLVENMPSGSAYRPDDILTFSNGKSVEIRSTDAEGRLILADALIYAGKLAPDILIDVATLTGACIVALGRYTVGVFTDDDRFFDVLTEASFKTGEKFWRLPLDPDLKKDIEGIHAELANTGKTRYGGAITAALFLKEFVPKNTGTWVHLDIAGPAFLESSWKYYEAGATGIPVATLVEVLSK